MDDEKPHWTVDRRIPVAMIIALLVNFGFGVWWVSSLSSRVDSLEKSEDARSTQGNRLTIVEQQLTFIQQTLGRIERKLDANP